jgi:hypothetical protein
MKLKNIEIKSIIDKISCIENDYYFRSYNHILDYFESINEFKEKDIYIGGQIVYGWMPTIFTLVKKNVGLENTLKILKNVKTSTERIDIKEFQELSKYINNSIVGTSKLLHFIKPQLYPIFDSKINSYLYKNYNEENYNKTITINNYQKYLILIDNLIEENDCDDYKEIKTLLYDKYNYEITTCRAIDIIIFNS